MVEETIKKVLTCIVFQYSIVCLLQLIHHILNDFINKKYFYENKLSMTALPLFGFMSNYLLIKEFSRQLSLSLSLLGHKVSIKVGVISDFYETCF